MVYPIQRFSEEIRYLVHGTSEDDRIIDFYQVCGFDPNSDELARQFNLPPIEYLPCI